MSNQITRTSYWTEVRETARVLVDDLIAGDPNITRQECLDTIDDTDLHETIDSHEWVIYCHNNLPVLTHSDNSEYGVDNDLVDANLLISQGGLSTLYTALAFWALYADVQDHISPFLDERFDGEECVWDIRTGERK